MDLTVLNTNFETIYILDTYESLIWVDKFSEPGTFEISTPVTDDILTYFKPNYYLVNEFSDHTMIIEDISIESNVEDGDKIKIIGRSLESILDRRIIWEQTTFKENHNLQKAIIKLVTRNISSTANIADRRISNFILADPATDTSITSLKLKDGAQYNGDNLLEVVKSLCEENKIGFKVILNEDNQFVFSLYNGVDRSYDQNDRPYVVYSPEFDNMISSNYKEENSKIKNVALVTNGDEENPIKRTIGTETGLNRRELYVEAGDLNRSGTQEDDSEPPQTSSISASDLQKLMDKRGKKELAETVKSVKSFDGQCDTTRMYVYGTDFFMGDIVQMANEYGMEDTSRITEFTWSCNTSGFETYPTFTAVEEEVEE